MGTFAGRSREAAGDIASTELPEAQRLPGSLIVIVALLAAALPSFAAGLPLTLDDAVRGAISNNLSLKAESFNPAISGTGIRSARAIYNPNFTALLDHRGSNSQSSPTSFFVDRTRSFDANLSASLLLPSGATASAAMTNLWEQDNQGTSFSRYAKPNLVFSLSQPVLQGFGRDVTERGITVATFATESTLAEWWAAALSVSSNTRNRFFALVKARENLEARKSSLALAREIHAGNEARVRAGVLAAIELLDSELGVAQREKDLLEAGKNALDEEDRLRVLLHLPPGTGILPADTFPGERVEATEEAALRTAAYMRPDLRKARILLSTNEFNARVGRNLLLPSLALKGSAGISGLGTDYGSAIDDMKTGKYPAWSVGVELSYPLGNDAAEADLAKNRLLAGQSRVSLRNLEEAASLEIRSSIRALDTGWRQIEVAGKGVALAEARLSSYVKRGKLGMATTKDTLQAESDLTVAREALAGARADYQAAVTQLWKSTGELLERHGIRIEDKEIESSAWKEIR
ncbi:MAG: TolC family protein [Deltaproteobacteria bacterium]|nr:TolC family protein [Deltaproteobacteria bacterium]